MKFWVQMYNLPLSGMAEPIGKIPGNKVENCLEVETDRDSKCWARCLRAHVVVDILKPLRRGAKVCLGSAGPQISVEFKYEKLKLGA
ncbi:hypothetical protein PanWU01x14_227100 [Parasponia andersonii]|uniref:DUF4283 domain-containing protein n=1 Tax=Parasponia andersonii TaxID=3476 RepID=A0A2P5BM66_PARAD|nr:hypothetical protein PanWU01x14_227100 [Parasponia andersonii]